MAGGLSRKIQESEAETDQFVALLAYRSITAYAGVLGILGAGCGYVPLHPEFPTERNFKVLDLAKTDLMIVGQECRQAFEGLLKFINRKMTFILVDIDESNKYAQDYPEHQFIMVSDLLKERGKQDIVPVRKDDIAYLLFTSGSTGQPKGVPVSHHNVRSYVEFITERYEIDEHDRCSQMHDMIFDFSVHDIYPTWEKGACLCVATKEDKIFPVSYIKKNKLTSWASVPSIGVIIDKYGRLEPNVFPDLRYSFFCGEALYMSLAEKWQRAAMNSKIVNLYGPTETTMAITCYNWDSKKSPNECSNGIVPIGKIFDRQMGRVVREDGEKADVGEAGELCLTGSQVTKGYWNNSEKTRLQYVTFPDTGEALWYRTGDLVQKGENGCLHYLDRIDNQVKVLGNRVELGEIAKILREASGVDLAVAVPWPVIGGNAAGVVAFICNTKKMDEKFIIEYCRNKLPEYMVPTRINIINEMPLNINGKIDRSKLTQMLKINK